MYVFDDEAGPLCPEDEAQRIAMLAAAGLTLEQFRAWCKVIARERLN